MATETLTTGTKYGDAKAASTLLPFAHDLGLSSVVRHLEEGDLRSAVIAAEMESHPAGRIFLDHAAALFGPGQDAGTARAAQPS